jgi:hypothetical protein
MYSSLKLTIYRGEQRGLLGRVSCHTFRRCLTIAGTFTEAMLAGHANVNTPGRYDWRPEETKRAAAAKLHSPYQRRG